MPTESQGTEFLDVFQHLVEIESHAQPVEFGAVGAIDADFHLVDHALQQPFGHVAAQ